MTIVGDLDSIPDEWVEGITVYDLEDILKLESLTIEEFTETIEYWNTEINLRWQHNIRGQYQEEQRWVYENMTSEKEFLSFWIDWWYFTPEQLSGDRKYALKKLHEYYKDSSENDTWGIVYNYNEIDRQIEAAQNEIEAYRDAIEILERTIERAQAIIDSIQSDRGDDRNSFSFVDVLSNYDWYANAANGYSENTGGLENKISIILTVITNIGMVIAILMSAIIGIKYMLGSVEEKAEYKKDMVPYLVGAVLIFGICAIIKVLQQLGQNINNI